MNSAVPHVQVRARTRGLTPRKLAIAAALARAEPTKCNREQQAMLDAIGPEGGYLTVKSSPTVMWLARQLAAQA